MRGAKVRSNENKAGLELALPTGSLARQAGRLIADCAGWLGKLRGRESNRPRLELVERITLAPKQSLALVEAEGRRLLVAISADGSPAFFALDQSTAQKMDKSSRARSYAAPRMSQRVSW